MATKRKPASAATRAKISKALKGKKHPHKGHAVSASTRAKLSKALKGKKHPHRGHPLSAATRAKLSAQRKGKKHPHKGHVMSASTRAKIAAALKARHHKDTNVRAKAKAKRSRLLHRSRATSNALLHHTIVRSRNPLRSHRPVRVTHHRMPHARRSRRPRRRH